MTTENASTHQSQNPALSLAGGIALGLLIASMGMMFTYFLVVGYGRATETRDWLEVPMTVTKSEIFEEQIGNSPPEFKAVVEYAFELEGVPYIGSGIKRVEGMTRHKNRAQRTIDRWPVGMTGTCWVNPEDPGETLLKHNTKAVLYTVWFPGLFVVLGLGIAIGSIRAHLRRAG